MSAEPGAPGSPGSPASRAVRKPRPPATTGAPGALRSVPTSIYFFVGAFFFPATVCRGPFRVRAFVCVR